MPKASSATIDIDAPLPTLPTVPGTLSDLQQQLADVIERIGKVPFDRIAGQLQDTLAGAEVATKSLTRTLDSARGAIEQLSPEASAALGDVRHTLAARRCAPGPPGWTAPQPFPSTGAAGVRATPGGPAAAEEEPVSR